MNFENKTTALHNHKVFNERVHAVKRLASRMSIAFPKMTHLSLPQVYLSPSGSKKLGAALASAPNLKSIDMHLARMSTRAWEGFFDNYFNGTTQMDMTTSDHSSLSRIRIHLALNQEPPVENLTVMLRPFRDKIIFEVDDVPNDVLSTALYRHRKNQSVCSPPVAVVDASPPATAPLRSRTPSPSLQVENENTTTSSTSTIIPSVRRQHAQAVVDWCYNRGWLSEDGRRWKLLAMIQRGLMVSASDTYLTCSYHHREMHTFDACLHHFSVARGHNRERPSLHELAEDIRRSGTSVLQRYSG